MQLMQSPEFKNAISVNKSGGQSAVGGSNPFIQNQPSSGLVAPNLSQQQGFQQQALGQMNQLASQAGQMASPTMSSNPLALANALRNKGSLGSFIPNAMSTTNAFMPWTQNEIANQYATDPYSEQSRMLALQERGL